MTKKGLEQRATELGQIVREIINRFEGANAAAANGPHADLTMQETRVVELLAESGAQMMRAVAEYLGVAVNSVTTIADNLERKGLLRRVRSDVDRRVVQVELTEAGATAGRSVMNVKARFHHDLLSALTEEEQAILLVLLRKVGGIRVASAPAPIESSSGQASPRKTAPDKTAPDKTAPGKSSLIRRDASNKKKEVSAESDSERTDPAHRRVRNRKSK